MPVSDHSGATRFVPAAPDHRWAVLSDLDGTLADTESPWLEAVTAVSRRWSISTAGSSLAWGVTLEQAARLLSTQSGGVRTAEQLAGELEDIVLQHLRAGVAWLPGAAQLLTDLAASDARLALVTSSPRRWVEEIAVHLDLSPFEVVITADDVEQVKPHPAPYLLAAQRLQVPMRRCVALEDSPPGRRAAERAGCQIFAVSTEDQPTQRLPGEVVRSLAELSPERIRQRVWGPDPTM